MAKYIDELITLLGFELSPGAIAAFNKVSNGIAAIRKASLYASGALVGLGYVTDRFVKGVDASAKFADGIGVSYETLQKMQFAAQKAGSSAKELDGALINMARTLTSLTPGEYNKTLFKLGISARDAQGQIKSVDKVILELADKYKKYNVIMRQKFGAEQGFGPTFVNFLAQGAAKIRKDMDEAARIGAVIPERLKTTAAAFYDDSLLKLKSTIKALSAVIALSLTPALIKAIDRFEKFIIVNKDLIGVGIGRFFSGVSSAIQDLSAGISVIVKVFSDFFNSISLGKEDIDALKIAGYALTAVMTGLAAATLAATWEWIALGAAIIAVVKAIKMYKDLASNVISSISDKFKEYKEMLSASNPFKSGFKNINEFVANQNESSGYDKYQQNTTNNSSPDNSRNVVNNTNNFTINTTANGRDLVDLIKNQLSVVDSFQVASPGYNRAKVG